MRCDSVSYFPLGAKLLSPTVTSDSSKRTLISRYVCRNKRPCVCLIPVISSKFASAHYA